MILTTISYDNNRVESEFPCNDDVLFEKLNSNGLPVNTEQFFFIKKVNEPSELSFIESDFVNLDELNYLAKRLDSFTDDELNQFYAAVDFKNVTKLKDLINFTFNLDKFTLIKNIGNMTEVGKQYILNTEGSIPANDRYDEKYADIGRNLLGTGRGIFTDKGLLFIENKPIEEVYDGHVFPAFAYKDFIVNIDINYNDKTESIFLPDSDLVIGKALIRLGASYLEDCKLSIEYENPNFDKLSAYFNEVMKNDGVVELNGLLKSIYEYDIDVKKLAAAIEYTEVSSAHDIGVLVDNIDNLELIEDVSYGDNEAVGRYFIDSDCYEEYEISDELQDFFDFAEFGEYIAEERSGQFISGGFLYYDGNDDMSVILDQLDGEDNSMTMGGI